MDKLAFPDTIWISLLGLCVVFVVLLILIVAIAILSKIVRSVEKTPAAPAPAAPAAPTGPARGSCGDVKLFDVPDRTAAMLMAIVADEMKCPLNELRFISIKEVEDASK